MAVFQWVARLENSDMHSALRGPLASAGFQIDDVGTTERQLSALCSPEVVSGYWSGVKLIVIWSNENDHQIKIEVRSDEPTLRPGTHCEQRAKALMEFLPPI